MIQTNKDLAEKLEHEIQVQCAQRNELLSIAETYAQQFQKTIAAAPLSSKIFRVEDSSVDGIKGAAVNEKALKALKCARDVIGRGIGDEFKPLYEEHKRKGEAIVQSDFMKCRNAEKILEFVVTFCLFSFYLRTIFDSFVRFLFFQTAASPTLFIKLHCF